MTGPERLAHLVVGEALVDVVVDSSGGRTEHPGGSPANVALGLARLDRAVALWTSFAEDRHGSALRDHLEGAGVEVIACAAERTATAVATLGPDGGATYDFDVTWALGPERPALAPQHVHTGSIAAVTEPGASAVADLVRDLRPTATISLDPNVRPALAPDRGTVRERLEGLVAHADVVKASDEDLAWLRPDQAPSVTAGEWLDLGPALVVVTHGAAGISAVSRAGEVRVESVPVTVADTVGAGDAVMAALLDGLQAAGRLGPHHREALRAIDPAALRDVLRRAARAAAITVSRPGAQPPSRAELDAAAAGGPS